MIIIISIIGIWMIVAGWGCFFISKLSACDSGLWLVGIIAIGCGIITILIGTLYPGVFPEVMEYNITLTFENRTMLVGI